MRLVSVLSALALLVFVSICAHASQDAVVRIYVFTSPDCTHCAPVHQENIQALAKKIGCKVEIKYFDIEDIENYQKLTDLEKKYGDTDNEMPVVFIGKDVLGGEKEAEEKLESVIAKHAASNDAPWPDEIDFDASKKPAKNNTSSNPQGSTPNIEFDKTEIDLGELESGKVAKAVFSFKNVGGRDLEIQSLRSSCGCFEPKAALSKVKPGQSSTIEVDFKTEGIGGDFSKSVMVDCNDPTHATTRLAVKAKIVPIATLSPTRLNFGTVSVNTSIERTLVITPLKPDGFTIVAIKSDGTQVSASERTKLNDGKGSYNIKIRIQSGSEPGRVHEKLTIRAYSSDGPTIPFVVYGNVQETETGDAKP